MIVRRRSDVPHVSKTSKAGELEDGSGRDAVDGGFVCNCKSATTTTPNATARIIRDRDRDQRHHRC